MTPHDARLYERIYAVVRQIPVGRVATYGQVASIVGDCTARMVGYAMAATPVGSDVPWQRVINAQGKISPRGDHLGSEEQRLRLEEEGVHFDANGKVDWAQVRWAGPGVEWLVEHGFDPAVSWTEEWSLPEANQPSLFGS
jgi:methylated-DNA-protein-cysteine methyltransferase-like protein